MTTHELKKYIKKNAAFLIHSLSVRKNGSWIYVGVEVQKHPSACDDQGLFGYCRQCGIVTRIQRDAIKRIMDTSGFDFGIYYSDDPEATPYYEYMLDIKTVDIKNLITI